MMLFLEKHLRTDISVYISLLVYIIIIAYNICIMHSVDSKVTLVYM